MCRMRPPLPAALRGCACAAIEETWAPRRIAPGLPGSPTVPCACLLLLGGAASVALPLEVDPAVASLPAVAVVAAAVAAADEWCGERGLLAAGDPAGLSTAAGRRAMRALLAATVAAALAREAAVGLTVVC